MRLLASRMAAVATLAGIVLVSAGAAWGAEGPPTGLNEGFEGGVPDLHTYQATYCADDTRAHTGRFSLRVTPTEASGGAYFRLGDRLDPAWDYEFSAWVWAGADGAARMYVSASDGTARHVKGEQASGGAAGQWVQLTGSVRRGELRDTDRETMLALVATTQTWFDDVVLRATQLPEPPMAVYPGLERRLRAAADTTAVRIGRGERVTLGAADGVLAPDLVGDTLVAVGEEHVRVPRDGLWTVAVECRQSLYVSGVVSLAPDEDLTPGLRAYVLWDSQLAAAPMVSGPEWGPQAAQAPMPDILGDRPRRRVELRECLLTRGCHYLTIAGPHFRPAGVLERVRLVAAERAVEEPVYRFALFADTHLGPGRPAWMNRKMDADAGGQLLTTLRFLADEGVAFALIAGDMTDAGSREQVELLAGVLAEAPMPVYGCIGNHDAFRERGRSDAVELLPEVFPGGATNYVLDRPPLRFMVLDPPLLGQDRDAAGSSPGAPEKAATGVRMEGIEWLRQVLAAEPGRPTVVMWHYAFYSRRGVSSAGYRLTSCACAGAEEVLGLLRAAPQVIATLNGHGHWNEVSTVGGVTHVQNTAFCEWPNSYRVFRVYRDRMEWEVRLPGNLGFVRESFLVPKKLSWMVSTGPGDLGGVIPLARCSD